MKKDIRTHSKKKKALALAQAGQIQEAKALYAQVCELTPMDAEAWFMSGSLSAQLGAHGEAEACFRRAATIEPKRPEIHYNLAKVLEAQGKTDQALESYREAIKYNPGFAAAYSNMGTLYQAQGLVEEALASYREAVRISPLPEAHYNLGNALKTKGCLDEATASYRSALQLKPDFYEAYKRLGITLYDLDRLDEAAENFEQVLRHHPDAMAAFGLGNVRVHQMRLEQAVSCYRQAIQLNPHHAEAHNNLGSALRIMSHQHEALSAFQEAVRLKPDYVSAHVNLGFVLIEYGRLDEALESFRQALLLDPGNARAAAGEANVYQRQGDYEKAYARIKPYLEPGSESIDVAMVFAALCRHVRRCDDAIAMLERLLAGDGASLHVHERVSLHFELGRLLDAAGDYDRAFAHFHQANSQKPHNFRPERHARAIDEIIHAYSAKFMATAPRATNKSRRPIFIVGMPRSGTSLVEQIIASHPAVFGAGELNEMHDIAGSLSKTLGTQASYPRCISALTEETCDLLSRRYLDVLAGFSKEAMRVTDKMPSNFLHLGLIALLFPEARIIHCVRDPLDTCLSCYFQSFADSQDFSYDLGHLGFFYRHYRRLMAHWDDVLDIAMMKVNYEQLVTEQEKLSREMVEFCGLEWDEQCLQFHRTQRAVATASYDQIRQPIYRKSVQRWKHYEQYLDPLKKALAGEE
jgi:tetratricopeptide (TPR) repeat protein